ncbi:hypothetical protein FE257_009355 [Aspergillus nanangensis]|uniref:Uncharacterized protein n=1 Tax=Aspergillus nanangensis TaxID=2582783 RepID=A0AAD4CKA5_ASPNN|nr:hypothetical protein FE257_009355 [Aspergillus nanangensis]
MAEYEPPVRPGYTPETPPSGAYDLISHRPYWAESQFHCAQDLLECTDEPIEYDHDDSDYWDNCFFFPEDSSWSPPKGYRIFDEKSEYRLAHGDSNDAMIPGLPDIKMLDAEALSDLLEDNLSPPEITSILASSGNLTGVNPASHPSSYVTAQSVSLGNVGSIVFELDDLVAVVTRIADKVLLAAVGPSKREPVGHSNNSANGTLKATYSASGGNEDEVPISLAEAHPAELRTGNQTPINGTPHNISRSHSATNMQTDAHLETQYQIDRNTDLQRLASLNLSASPAILLALESKSAALGRFLSQKLDDLESPEDF